MQTAVAMRSHQQASLPCVSLLPLIFLLTLLNKSLLSPPSTTYMKVTGFSKPQDVNTVLHPRPHTQVDTLYNIRIHPLSRLLHNLIVTNNQTSLLSFPCAKHITVTHPLLQLLTHTNRLSSFSYICQDPDSRNLANAHAQLSQTLPKFVATYRRANFTKSVQKADILLTSAASVNNVRRLLLKSTSAGIRFVVLNSPAMPGLPPPVMEQPIERFRTVYSDAPFPFAHAIVGVSSAYGFGQHYLLVYDLSYLPTVTAVTNLTKLQVATDLIRDKMRTAPDSKSD